MQGGWFGAMERMHNLESCASEPIGQNEGDQSYFAAFLTLSMCFFSERSAKQFRQIGQNCKGKHRERSSSVSLALFFFRSSLF